jgi:signal peptidase I
MKQKTLLTLTACLLLSLTILFTGCGIFPSDTFTTTVNGTSMQPTIPNGTTATVQRTKIAQAGDIIVFTHPNGGNWISRLIAVGGDKIAFVGRGNNEFDVYLNDELLVEEYLDQQEYWGRTMMFSVPFHNSLTQQDDTWTLTIPLGHMFVMGDNRGVEDPADFVHTSRDSRHFGTVGMTAIVGKVII